MKRSTVQLLAYLVLVAVVSLVIAGLLAPVLPYPYLKILRRTATVIAALTLWPFLTKIQRRRLQELGLEYSSCMHRQFVQGFALGLALFGSLLFLLWGVHVVGWHLPRENDWFFLIAFFPAAACIGLLEELFFRGAVLQSLQRDFGATIAVIVSSALYAILHFAKFLAHPLAILPELCGLFFFGCLLAYAYLRTRLLAFSIGLHMSLAYLAKMGRRFLEFQGREPQWLFGTDRWVNSLLAWGMFCVAFLFIAYLTRPHATVSR